MHQSTKQPTAVREHDDPAVIDKEAYWPALDALNVEIGVRDEPDLSTQEIRALMLADGVRPEDNAFSRELIRMRYEEGE